MAPQEFPSNETHISKQHLSMLLSIARAEFAYDPSKEIGSTSGMQLTEDEPELGYVRFDIHLFPDAAPRSLVVNLAKNGTAAFAFLHLFLFPDIDSSGSDFDVFFHVVAHELEQTLGKPSASGDYKYEHRNRPYNYRWWSLPDAELVLVQDEFDIQDGFDVTLWILRAATPRSLPVRP